MKKRLSIVIWMAAVCIIPFGICSCGKDAGTVPETVVSSSQTSSDAASKDADSSGQAGSVGDLSSAEQQNTENTEEIKDAETDDSNKQKASSGKKASKKADTGIHGPVTEEERKKWESESEEEDSVSDKKRTEIMERYTKQQYYDGVRQVNVLGLKTYQKLIGKKFMDKAGKGKVYLVLFLSIRNEGSEKKFFDPNRLTAEVDGKEVENTFLVNEPEGYPTIFTNVEPGSTVNGFVTWLVPKDWKKLHLVYPGFESDEEEGMEMNLTKKDILSPPVYSGED